MISLRDLETPTFRDGACETCGAFVANTAKHAEYHRELVAWLRALRDGKVVPPMKGFTSEAADAWWLTCNACGDTELFYGLGGDIQAMTWATEHLKECAG